MNSDVYKQSVFIKVYRFAYYFVITAIIHLFVFYIYGYNIFTSYVLTGFLSLIISFSLTTNDKFPIFKTAIMYFLLLIVNSRVSINAIEWLDGFYNPSLLWTILMTISIPFGIVSGIGRYGNGRMKIYLENYSNLALLIIIILAFVFFWWKGGIMYLIIRIPLMIIEISMANTILYYATRSNLTATK